MKITRKYVKFLIDTYYIFKEYYIKYFLKLICCCNIRFFYKTKKIIINIIGHQMRKLQDEDQYNIFYDQ